MNEQLLKDLQKISEDIRDIKCRLNMMPGEKRKRRIRAVKSFFCNIVSFFRHLI